MSRDRRPDESTDEEIEQRLDAWLPRPDLFDDGEEIPLEIDDEVPTC